MKTENQTKNLNKMDSQRELYQSPKLEVFEIKLEKGFAGSVLSDGTDGANNWGTGNTW